MTGGRVLLKSILGPRFAAPVVGLFGASRAAALYPAAGTGRAVRRHGGVFLADGRVLTGRDPEALGGDAL